MYDLKITGGTIVDGTGRAPFVGDVAVKDGTIVAIGPRIDGDSAQTIDARGLLVTPGFVDIHTHYDGQVTWDPLLEPSTGHGVTTIVTGNCGVGFAPVKPGTQEWLIQLMEGVEDIPGTALTEGMSWDWETFPEYLDALDKRPLSIDVGTQIADGAVRAYVMGERGAKNLPAGPDDIAAMGGIVREAVEAGALGFRRRGTLGHRAMDGEPVPGTFAAEDELFGIGREMSKAGRAVFELAPAGASGEDLVAPMKEVDWMRRLSAETGLPVSFALLQVDAAPSLWRELMDESLRAYDEGAQIFPQVAGRPFGMLIGFQTHHAFSKRPTFQRLAASSGSIEELTKQLLEPKIRAQILAEEDLPPEPVLFDGLNKLVQMATDRLYQLGNPPNYEPEQNRTVSAIAAAQGAGTLETLYDLFCEEDGRALLMLPMFNYSDGNLDAVHDMLTHPAGVVGLSDGGAHCGMICDASMPTFMLTHWSRDRSRGAQLPIETVIKKQTHDTAQLFGLGDRGTLEVGKKADLNIIDHENLQLMQARMAFDLPAGGRRLLQEAKGYKATIVNGVVTRRDGVDTGARPGQLLRGVR